MSVCSHEPPSRHSVCDVCAECGSILSAPLSTSKAQRGAEAKGPVTSKCIVKSKRGPYKPRKSPTSLKEKRARREVKVDMIAAVPGVSRAKAEAVVNTCEGSMARMVGVSATEFARVIYRGAPIGQELGVAIWRALH